LEKVQTGQVAKFTITARDNKGNERKDEDEFEFLVDGPSPLDIQVFPQGNGVYECE
jgi:hypothetical protein